MTSSARPARDLAQTLLWAQAEGFSFEEAWLIAWTRLRLPNGQDGDGWAILICRYQSAWREQWNAGSLPQMARPLTSALERIERRDREHL